MNIPVLVDLQIHRYISSVGTHDTYKETCREQWVIGMEGERNLLNYTLSIIIIIIIIIITFAIFFAFFTPVLTGGHSQESERQQVSSLLQCSSQYSGL